MAVWLHSCRHLTKPARARWALRVDLPAHVLKLHDERVILGSSVSFFIILAVFLVSCVSGTKQSHLLGAWGIWQSGCAARPGEQRVARTECVSLGFSSAWAERCEGACVLRSSRHRRTRPLHRPGGWAACRCVCWVRVLAYQHERRSCERLCVLRSSSHHTKGQHRPGGWAACGCGCGVRVCAYQQERRICERRCVLRSSRHHTGSAQAR
jgi:hypothetical protein